MDPLPVLTSFTEEEKRICQLQNGFAERLKKSAYYIVEPTKSEGASVQGHLIREDPEQRGNQST